MVKRLLAIVSVLIVVVLIGGAAGGAWFVSRLQGHLTPPADPGGQESIALLANPIDSRSRVGVPFTGTEQLTGWAGIDDPPLSARPWTRWWWPGGDVELTVLRAQLDDLFDSGFGGVEVQPFIGGMINVADNEGVMDRVYSFDSPAYHQTLKGAIDYAHTLGMEVDLTNFSGWPPGGPQINLEDSPTVMAYGEATVTGGGEIVVDLPLPKPGPAEYIFSVMEFAGIDFMNFPVEHANLLSVIAARVEDGEHHRNPFYLADTVSLAADSIEVLTDRVVDGVLHWDAPEGEWQIVASYLLPSGEVPMGAAQKPQGFVVDHLRKDQVLGQYAYAFGERADLPAVYGRGMRGIFNDSLEFRLRRMSVEDILEEFRVRRGYSLEPYLPALYVEGIDNVYFKEILGIYAAPEFRLTDMDDRIRHDYQQTLSDLVIERFVETSARWAEQRGLTSRGQSYGMDMDLLRGLGANTIPETEQLWAGGANVGLKFASSAGALYGRPLVSAESFVWINRDYMPAARRVKAAADKLFLAGINHIVYHGTPYPWQGGDTGDFGEEGWQPFSGPQNPAHFSGNFSAANTAMWPDLPDLNRYIARSQNLLRRGRPAIDVLVYYPFLGFHGSNRANDKEVLISGALPDADPRTVMLESGPLVEGKKQLAKILTTPEHIDPRVAWMESLQPLLGDLDRRGITWAWVNDHALQTGRASEGMLPASGGRYGALLLPNIESLEPGTLDALAREVRSGIPVLFAGDLPERQRSFNNAESGDEVIREGLVSLLEAGALRFGSLGEELRTYLVENSSAALPYADASTIHRFRRTLDGGGELIFFGNQSPEPARLSMSVAGDQDMWWFDAISGAAWPVEAHSGQIDLALTGFDSRFLIRGVRMPDSIAGAPPPAVAAANATSMQALDAWHFNLGDYRAAGDEALIDWRDIPALRYADGPGIYTHQLMLAGPPEATKRYLLDLGLVQGSARVLVNSELVGGASLPPFTLDITPALKPGDNVIEVEVRPPLRNLFVGRAFAGDPLYAQMADFGNELVAAGLLGPVTLFISGAP